MTLSIFRNVFDITPISKYLGDRADDDRQVSVVDHANPADSAPQRLNATTSLNIPGFPGVMNCCAEFDENKG